MMKLTNFTKYLGLAGIAVISTWVIACSDMTSAHEKYTEGGEVVYRGKADSVLVFPGKNRVKISWLLLTDSKISSSRIYWNERSDSLKVGVQQAQGVKAMTVMLDSLKEGPYVFEIVGFDDAGNSSLPVTASGRAYGPVYEDGLLNRLVQGNGFTTEDEAFLEWSNASEEVIGTELIYTDDTGTPQTVFVSPSESATLLDDYQLHSTYKYRTLYKPEPTAIDTFYTAYNEEEVEGEPAPVFTDTTYTLVARHSSKAVAVADSSISNGGNVIQDTYDAAAPEQWDISAEVIEGYYQYYVIANRYSGKAMAVSGASHDNGANILQWDRGSGGNDLWTIVWVDDEHFRIQNLNSGRVLEIADNDMGDGANLQQNEWNGGENQQFRIEVVASPAAPNSGPQNLALNPAGTLRSSDCSCGRAEEAFDGGMETFWQPLGGDRGDFHVYIGVDLGSSQTFNQMDQYWRSGNSQVVRYRVSYSDDGNNWTLAYMKEVDGLGLEESAIFPSPVTARYVRLDIDNNDDGNVQIREIEIYNNE